MYLDEIASRIRDKIPSERMPDGDADGLLRLYSVLLLAKGTEVSESDIHSAWSVWMAREKPDHPALIPYSDLPENTRLEDHVFAEAVRKAAEELAIPPTQSDFVNVLFPAGPPSDAQQIAETLDLYKVMVDSSERLVGRRQAVNTFFLTMNGALLTAGGIVIQLSGTSQLGALAVAVIAAAGAILCGAWRSLITSFGQLNRGKFKVINTLERYLRVAVYAAEWEALGRGVDPKIYRSFTSREIWVPTALLAIYVIAALVALFFASGLEIQFPKNVTS